MSKFNFTADTYFTDGCGRCELGGTPACKVNSWPEELKTLRKIILDCTLSEEIKWGVPCYTFKNRNVVLLSAFKEYCAISFFKGALLNDNQKVLFKPGENSQATRQLRFTGIEQIKETETLIKRYIFEAIEIEKAGLKINFNARTKLELPEELKSKMNKIPALRIAFNALTPGRQRGYILYFSAAKQATTRQSRVEKYIPKIMEGKGIND